MRQNYVHSHYCSTRKRPITEHLAKAEKALGKFLPFGAVVHHLDGNHLNNQDDNLVICPDEAYHNLLHSRLAAFKACGDANKLRCYICKDYDDRIYLSPVKKADRAVTTFYHPQCRRAYVNQRRQLARSQA